MLSLLGLTAEVMSVDLKLGDHNGREPRGHDRYPVIDDNGVIVADANAILIYLAANYGEGQWLPTDHQVLAGVLCWLSLTVSDDCFASGIDGRSLELDTAFEAEGLIIKTLCLLKEMDLELAESTFLVGAHPTIADVSAYAYLAHLPKQHVGISNYANVCRWRQSFESLPHFLSIKDHKKNNGKVHDWGLEALP
ncbi:glutathione S-transferase family protein [Pseudomonas siliginis]|uniref:glutathione S-transferase family protein n=1 Tax=Pseudomonas siliginis TaxID=2842346 RepID=UPI00386BA665